MSNSIKVHELPVSETAQDSDYVLTSLSQTTKRISFKNMISKISFQNLKTTAKNLLDAINENKADIDTAKNSLTLLNTNLGDLQKISIKSTTLVPPFNPIAANSAVSIPITNITTNNIINAIWYSGGGTSGLAYVSFASGYIHFRNISGVAITPNSTNRIHIFYY